MVGEPGLSQRPRFGLNFPLGAGRLTCAMPVVVIVVAMVISVSAKRVIHVSTPVVLAPATNASNSGNDLNTRATTEQGDISKSVLIQPPIYVRSSKSGDSDSIHALTSGRKQHKLKANTAERVQTKKPEHFAELHTKDTADASDCLGQCPSFTIPYSNQIVPAQICGTLYNLPVATTVCPSGTFIGATQLLCMPPEANPPLVWQPTNGGNPSCSGFPQAGQRYVLVSYDLTTPTLAATTPLLPVNWRLTGGLSFDSVTYTGSTFDGTTKYLSVPVGLQPDGITVVPLLGGSMTFVTRFKVLSSTGAWSRVFDFGNAGSTNPNVAPTLLISLARRSSSSDMIFNNQLTLSNFVTKYSGASVTLAVSVSADGSAQAFVNGNYETSAPPGTVTKMDFAARSSNFIGHSNWNSAGSSDGNFAGTIAWVTVYAGVFSNPQLATLSAAVGPATPDLTNVGVWAPPPVTNPCGTVNSFQTDINSRGAFKVGPGVCSIPYNLQNGFTVTFDAAVQNTGGCSDVQVVLSRYAPGVDSSSAFEISFGGWGNTQSYASIGVQSGQYFSLPPSSPNWCGDGPPTHYFVSVSVANQVLSYGTVDSQGNQKPIQIIGLSSIPWGVYVVNNVPQTSSIINNILTSLQYIGFTSYSDSVIFQNFNIQPYDLSSGLAGWVAPTQILVNYDLTLAAASTSTQYRQVGSVVFSSQGASFSYGNNSLAVSVIDVATTLLGGSLTLVTRFSMSGKPATLFDFGNGPGLDSGNINLYVNSNGDLVLNLGGNWNDFILKNFWARYANLFVTLAISVYPDGSVLALVNGNYEASVLPNTVGLPRFITRSSNFIGASNWGMNSASAGSIGWITLYAGPSSFAQLAALSLKTTTAQSSPPPPALTAYQALTTYVQAVSPWVSAVPFHNPNTCAAGSVICGTFLDEVIPTLSDGVQKLENNTWLATDRALWTTCNALGNVRAVQDLQSSGSTVVRHVGVGQSGFLTLPIRTKGWHTAAGQLEQFYCSSHNNLTGSNNPLPQPLGASIAPRLSDVYTLSSASSCTILTDSSSNKAVTITLTGYQILGVDYGGIVANVTILLPTFIYNPNCIVCNTAIISIACTVTWTARPLCGCDRIYGGYQIGVPSVSSSTIVQPVASVPMQTFASGYSDVYNNLLNNNWLSYDWQALGLSKAVPSDLKRISELQPLSVPEMQVVQMLDNWLALKMQSVECFQFIYDHITHIQSSNLELLESVYSYFRGSSTTMITLYIPSFDTTAYTTVTSTGNAGVIASSTVAAVLLLAAVVPGPQQPFLAAAGVIVGLIGGVWGPQSSNVVTSKPTTLSAIEVTSVDQSITSSDLLHIEMLQYFQLSFDAALQSLDAIKVNAQNDYLQLQLYGSINAFDTSDWLVQQNLHAERLMIASFLFNAFDIGFAPTGLPFPCANVQLCGFTGSVLQMSKPAGTTDGGFISWASPHYNPLRSRINQLFTPPSLVGKCGGGSLITSSYQNTIVSNSFNLLSANPATTKDSLTYFDCTTDSTSNPCSGWAEPGGVHVTVAEVTQSAQAPWAVPHCPCFGQPQQFYFNDVTASVTYTIQSTNNGKGGWTQFRLAYQGPSGLGVVGSYTPDWSVGNNPAVWHHATSAFVMTGVTTISNDATYQTYLHSAFNTYGTVPTAVAGRSLATPAEIQQWKDLYVNPISSVAAQPPPMWLN